MGKAILSFTVRPGGPVNLKIQITRQSESGNLSADGSDSPSLSTILTLRTGDHILRIVYNSQGQKAKATFEQKENLQDTK